MKTVRSACVLQPQALNINVGDQIEKLDELIAGEEPSKYFAKTFITGGMKDLLTKGIARLAGKSNNSVFHLKQAMGGGKTHIMIGFGLLAKDSKARQNLIGTIPYQSDFDSAKIAAFNGRNQPETYFWGEVAQQLGKEALFRKYWESGVKAPDEQAWLDLFTGDEPILILLDEMPPYFHYYSTQQIGNGTIADIVTRAFSCMLTAAQKKSNVCIVVSDLEAAYDTGGKLIQRALNDSAQELGRAEISITPVNLESNEIYEILRKRLFESLPDNSEIADIASVYAQRLAEAARAKTVERSAESIADEIEATYPFHPSFKSIVALFKENESFKQTRGLMELVSRLLKSVWGSSEDIYLIGAQHFDLSLPDVREKITDISKMRDVIAKDLWDDQNGAHAQIIDNQKGNNYAKQVGTLLLLASLSTAVKSVKGLSEQELYECLIDPVHKASDFTEALNGINKTAWYLHQTEEGRTYFDRIENLTKKLQGYADKAPENKVDDLIRFRLNEMFAPKTKEAYEKVLPLPEMDEAEAELKSNRALLIISPDGKTPPSVVSNFYRNLVNKNNALILTGESSSMASVENSAKHVYAVLKASNDIKETDPQRKELEEKKIQYEQDFGSSILSMFNKLFFPRYDKSKKEDILVKKVLNSTYSAAERYDGEQQVIKTLIADPLKLYIDVNENFDVLRARAESVLFGNIPDMRKSDLVDRMKQNTQMPWMPYKGLDSLIREACMRGCWEDLDNGYITKQPKEKLTEVIANSDYDIDSEGFTIIKVDTANAGNTPRIYFKEDGEVSERCEVLKETSLRTKALRVQFLAVDTTGANKTGTPSTWENRLAIQRDFDKDSRKVTLQVTPKGNIKYTLDGSDSRNGTDYTEPFVIGNEATTVYAFAECEGLEVKKSFDLPKKGETKVHIDLSKPANLACKQFKRFDNSARVYDGLRQAKEKNIEFEQVNISLGSGANMISLTLGEIKVNAEFIIKELENLRSLVDANAPVIMKFKRVYTKSGHDLEIFAKELGIVFDSSEVEQND